MELIDTLFSNDKEIVDKLKEYAVKPDYKKIFFEHLGPELKKVFLNKKSQKYYNNFLEASQYEYGFFDKEIDLSKAFNLYKKYADLNDYFCMYKMHIIYLCENEKFNVPFSRVLEKLYLLKSFAYLPNYVLSWDFKLFEKIDIKKELESVLNLEDANLENHYLFLDLLNYQKDNYNLSENDINLMKGVLTCYFYKGNTESKIMEFSILNSIMPKNDLDYAYYRAKNKCIYFQNFMNIGNIISDDEIDQFYKEVENKKIYELYGDYGNYLMDKIDNANQEIVNIFSISAEKGDLFGTFRTYQSLINLYDLDIILEDYDKACSILDYLLDEVVFERLLLSQFIILMGLLIKYSKFIDKISSKYLVYVKEINDYITSIIKRKEKENEIFKEDEDYLFSIKAYIYYFGFKNVEEKNLPKAAELLEKGLNLTKERYSKRRGGFFRYNILKEMNNLKLISNEEFIKQKKDYIKFINDNLNLKHEYIDSYILGKDFYEGFSGKKDEFITLVIFKFIQNIFCGNIIDWKIKNDIKNFVKNNEGVIENKFENEICCICYTNKVGKIFIPCGHYFCSFCADLLEKEDDKCPVCRTKCLLII